LFYIGAYLTRSRVAYLLRPLPLMIWFGGLYIWLAPKMGEMLVPVTVYMAVIFAMVWRALSLVEKPWESWALAAFGGAVIFAISDSLIAIQLFRGPFPGDQIWIILTYWSGQWLITRSIDIG